MRLGWNRLARRNVIPTFSMGASAIIHRLSIAGMVLFAATYITCIIISEGNGARLLLAAMMLIHGVGGAWIVWCLTIATTVAAFLVRRRHPSSTPFFAAALLLAPLVWIGSHILACSQALPSGEYWGYYLDLVMVRWMLVPWFAQYSFTLFIACLAIWTITRPISRRRVG